MLGKLFLILACTALPLHAANHTYSAQLVKSGLGVPWGMAFIDPSNMLVNDKDGRISLLHIPSGGIKVLKQVADVFNKGQGGLLDVAASPNEHGRFYFTYSRNTGQGGATTLATARLVNDELTEWQDLLVSDSATGTGRHFGSRIAFDDAGFVYFSIGDRGERPNGQDTSNHAGAILRLTPDGKVPPDNPYLNNSSVRDEIWSYGHRNPQGLFFDNLNKALWSIEHGPRGGDEVNLIKKGANYGWPVTSHGKEYWGPVKVADYEEKEGIESPKKVYIPSIAPSNIILYRGDKYPELNGKLLAGALKLTHINVLTLDNKQNITDEKRLLESLGQRIRDIKISPDGYIYFSTDNGNIYRLVTN
jgi:glucose/arabinose dehydrogenase